MVGVVWCGVDLVVTNNANVWSDRDVVVSITRDDVDGAAARGEGESLTLSSLCDLCLAGRWVSGISAGTLEEGGPARSRVGLQTVDALW